MPAVLAPMLVRPLAIAEPRYVLRWLENGSSAPRTMPAAMLLGMPMSSLAPSEFSPHSESDSLLFQNSSLSRV
jgi:hypothetical protein